MAEIESGLRNFVAYVDKLDGDEKGEAQVFCERLFQAFGWPGYKEAGAHLEGRVRMPGDTRKVTTKFVDLLWPAAPPRPGCLIEMKKRGEKLAAHYQQVFEYWQHLVPHRPRYVILCNFDELWIYDFDMQLYEPVDQILVRDLSVRHVALNFMLPTPKKPQFGNDRVAVTREAADKLARLFNRLVRRGIDRDVSQRFVLQCVVSMFAEDIGLLPRGLFTELVDECRAGASSHDLLGQLFRWMNSSTPPKAGRYKGVRYFNGGLFSQVEPLELIAEELDMLMGAAAEDWSKVQPAIFGVLFQSSMGKDERHALGAHYTSEADIQKVVLPTLVRPFRERIAAAKTREALMALRVELEQLRVLDPSCGSGNFLYVAYRELVRVEMELVHRLRTEFSSARVGKKAVAATTFVGIKQFYGIDISEFAIALAQVTLLCAKKLAYDEVNASAIGQLGLSLMADPLPLDDLGDNLVCQDALFATWPPAGIIIGNPPFQSKNKMQEEFGAEYVQRLRKRYPEVPGRADYCVYWFRRAHDALPAGGRAGLVGTNTIRQNYSREGGLDYIVHHGGVIVEAVSTQVWSGAAAVHVSIVNWVKGKASGKKVLLWQQGDRADSPWGRAELDRIGPALAVTGDVTSARPLKANVGSGACYQGQTHGHEGFLLTPEEARALIRASRRNAEIIFPFLIADDLLGNPDGAPGRHVIDFGERDLHAASSYRAPFAHVKARVLPDRQRAAERERERNDAVLREDPEARVNRHHAVFLSRWWRLSWGRGELLARIEQVPRYIVCAQVTKRPIFEFVAATVRPNAALIVFPLADDYSFGVLQSQLHWQWFVARCSTLKGDYRYTSATVFDAFPWPQSPTRAQVKAVARASVKVRALRQSLLAQHGLSRREIYRLLDGPGRSPLADAHAALDLAVRAAYGMAQDADGLAALLDLNLTLAAHETAGRPVQGPGLPRGLADVEALVTADAVGADP